ncbi:hypothetical protein BGZ83_005329 [Gryganskiella cystojenkinii]|nr:hypothetical protein BGZ83_005329 [Gryganskiella cystojenkinii]
MRFFALSAITATAIGLAQAYTTSIPVARDATVSFNGITCDNNIPCNSIPFGRKLDLVSFQGNRDYERILLGFDLPANSISKCVLKIPFPIEVPTNSDYSLTVTVTDNNWAEDTVTGANKNNGGSQIGSVNVLRGQKPGDIDVTSSCQSATGGKLSLFVGTGFTYTRFNSVQSGSSAIFSLDEVPGTVEDASPFENEGPGVMILIDENDSRFKKRIKAEKTPRFDDIVVDELTLAPSRFPLLHLTSASQPS